MATTKAKKPKYEYIGWLIGNNGGVENVEMFYNEGEARVNSNAYIKIEINPVLSSPGRCVGVVPYVKV